MTSPIYHRFDAKPIDAPDRFEYWRDWCAHAVDVPMRLERVGRRAGDFNASAEALSVGLVGFVDHRSGPVQGSWTQDATRAAERLRLMILAPAAGGKGFCHGHTFSLDRGAAALVGATDGGWETTNGLRGIQVNVPREALPITDQQLVLFNDQRRLLRDPTFIALVRPAMLGLSGHLEALAHRPLVGLPELWISLLTMLARSLADDGLDGIDTGPARRLQINRYIEAKLADPRLSPGMIADALHISRTALYAASAPDTGIAADIARRRVARAHAMLSDPKNTQSIAKIGELVGIPNPAHFSRTFRKHYGLSARQLRADSRAEK